VTSDGSRRRSPRSYCFGFLVLNHRRLSAFIGVCLAVVCAVAGAQPVSVTDDRGKVVTLARPAQRIVTLAPSLAELAFAAGAGGRLVGVAHLSLFPPAARDIPQVGDAVSVDFERIVQLKPDLVLAWRSGNSAAAVERLERLGLPAWVSEARRLADIPRELRAIGVLAGTSTAAEKAAADFEREIGALRGRFTSTRKVRVFYEIWHQPLMTVSGAHLISDVIALCGGENVFSDVSQLTPTVSQEAVIAAKPEAILGGGSAGGEKAFAATRRALPPPLRGLPAFYIDPDSIQQATPRIVEGARAVCSALEKVRAGQDLQNGSKTR
jgi:iron complex transport system substrate-binding protein